MPVITTKWGEEITVTEATRPKSARLNIDMEPGDKGLVDTTAKRQGDSAVARWARQVILEQTAGIGPAIEGLYKRFQAGGLSPEQIDHELFKAVLLVKVKERFRLTDDHNEALKCLNVVAQLEGADSATELLKASLPANDPKFQASADLLARAQISPPGKRDHGSLTMLGYLQTGELNKADLNQLIALARGRFPERTANMTDGEVIAEFIDMDDIGQLEE